MSESKVKPPAQRALPAPAERAEAAVATVVREVEATVAEAARVAVPRQENPFAGPAGFAFFGAAQSAAQAVADEIAGLTRSGFATMAETTAAMLGVKTLSDAIEVNAGFFRKSFETMLAGSTRLSEIGARLVTESVRPLAR